MNISFFRNIRKKRSIFTVIGICLVAVILSAAAVFFSDIIDDDEYSLSLQAIPVFEPFINTYLIEKNQDPFLSIATYTIHGRSPPLV